MKNNKVKILMLEQIGINENSIIKFYENIFAEIGYETDINLINKNVVSSRFDFDILNTQPIDIFISDLSFGSEDSYEGLNIIQFAKIRFPELFIIAQSSAGVQYLDTAAKYPTFDLFIHKARMNDRNYKEYITLLIKDKFRKNVFLNFNHNESKFLGHSRFKEAKDFVELNNILRTITFTSHTATEDTSVTKITLDPITDGYSGSEVFKMNSYTKNNIKCIQSILKISSPENLSKELNNYQNYVKWYLPFSWRPDILGTCITKRIGAICYSFINNEVSDFFPLTHYIKNKDHRKINFAIDHVFKPVYKRWYHENNLYEHDNITEYYQSKWFSEKEINDKKFIKLLKSYDISEQSNVIINGESYPKPAKFLFGTHRNKYKKYICHGDLNSNNIFISDNNLVFIDFQDTSKGHVFEDFVVFETSLRLYYDFSLSFEDLLQFENNICESHINKMISTDNKINLAPEIIKLRNYANETCIVESLSNYYYALAVNCFKLLRINDLHDWQTNQILSCLLSSMRYLGILENPLL